MARIIFFLLCVTSLWAEYLPDRVLVKLRPAATVQAQSYNTGTISPKLKKLLDSQGLSEITQPFAKPQTRSARTLKETNNPLAGYFLVQYPASVNVELLVEMLKNDAEVETAQPVFVYRIMATEDAPTYDVRQYYLPQIDAPRGWDISTGSAAIKIAVLDSGVSRNHPVLKDRLKYGYNAVDDDDNFDDVEGHGTAVSGIIAALDLNAIIVPIRVGTPSGSIDTVAAARGVERVYSPEVSVNIINMSFGGRVVDPLLEAACAEANRRGVLLVAAMGNTGGIFNIRPKDIMYPAAYDNVISVGSVNEIGNLSSFSVRGTMPHIAEVMAPGEKMWTTLMDGEVDENGYGYAGNGTSFAAPLVSGLLGLMKAHYVGVPNQELVTILHNSSGPGGRYEEYGHGIINVYRALSKIPYGDFADSKLEQVLTFPNPAEKSLRFSFNTNSNVESVEIFIYNQRGVRVAEMEYGSQLIAGTYITPEWDLQVNNKYLANGSYIYVLKATLSDGSISYGRNVFTIVR